MKTIKEAVTVVITMCVLMGASAWADTTNSGNLYVVGFVDAAGFGNQAGTNTVGAVNSIFIGPDAGFNATYATNSAVFGAFSTIPSGARYQFVYGAYMTNGAPDFSHVFGHLGTNYVAFTKDGAFFYVPITLVAGNLTLTNGTVNFSGATVTGLDASQISIGHLDANVMPAGGTWNAGNMTITNVVLRGNDATVYGNLTVTNGTLRGGSDQIVLQVNPGAVAMGNNANGANSGTAIGWNVLGTNFSVAVGVGSTSTTYSVAIGPSARASNLGTAVGPGANAPNNGVAVGHGAFGANGSTALGPGAQAVWGVSIGYQTTSTNEATSIGAWTLSTVGGTAIGHASGGIWFGTAVGNRAQAENMGFAGGVFAKAKGVGSIAIGGDVTYWGGLPARIADGYYDAIQLGRNRVGTNAAPELAAHHYLRVWGGVADGGIELNGNNGTLSVSNLTVQGVVALPVQGDISMGSFTNGPSQ